MTKKKWIVAAAFLGAFIIFSGLKNLSRDVNLQGWYAQADGYAQAYQQHQKTGKPIVVLFYTDWCASCKVLKADILSSPNVKEFMASTMIAVKINPERSANDARLARQFGVVAYPMMFVVNKEGTDIKRVRRTSRITPEQFIAQLQQMMVTP